MTRTWRMLGILMLLVVITPVLLVSVAWATLALWYELPGGEPARIAGSVIWLTAALILAGVAMTRRRWWPLGIYALLHVLLLAWWSTIAPTNHRVWADDVSHLLSGAVQGSVVTLDNVRNFNWRSDSDYDAHWETRRYDLDHLTSADLVLSYWGGKAIAHTMISFGFDDGRHVVFSVETRKRRDQQYSAIGGFFKQYEAILVAADENDIIRVRTNVRDEDDYLYPLHISPASMRALFLTYVRTANRLATTPAFYNTITTNCTTVIYRMARQIDSDLPLDARLLLTGYLPGYLYKIGALDHRLTLNEWERRARITDRARAIAPGEDFSRAIRTPSH